MAGEPGGAYDTLDRFRLRVLEDAALQQSLGSIEDGDAFIAATIAAAHHCGLEVAPDALKSRTRPDPLGLERFAHVQSYQPRNLQKGWLPIEASRQSGCLTLDWAYFGRHPLSEPFYAGSVRHAMQKPFNRFFRFRGPLLDVERLARRPGLVPPSGFIFHMSRCGSTLAAQMLAALPKNIVVSEASPIDGVVQFASAAGSHASQAEILGAIVRVFGQVRSGGERQYFIKLDSWHALALPLFRRTFPTVPWVFLYRDPVEVMISQMRQRGTQMVPEIVAPSLYGIELTDGAPMEDYCARVLGRICEAALDAYASGGGLLVNYSQLPDAVWTRILPHFGIANSDDERAVMARAALFDAKTPGMAFVPHGNRQDATDRLRVAAAMHVGGVFRALEALRLGAQIA